VELDRITQEKADLGSKVREKVKVSEVFFERKARVRIYKKGLKKLKDSLI